LIDFAKRNDIDITIVGPEGPLVFFKLLVWHNLSTVTIKRHWHRWIKQINRHWTQIITFKMSQLADIF
jgi:hypothetical protein